LDLKTRLTLSTFVSPDYEFSVGEFIDIGWVLEFYSEYFGEWIMALTYETIRVHFYRSLDGGRTWDRIGDAVVEPEEKPEGAYAIGTGTFRKKVECEEGGKTVLIKASYDGCNTNFSPGTLEDGMHLLPTYDCNIATYRAKQLVGICWKEAVSNICEVFVS